MCTQGVAGEPAATRSAGRAASTPRPAAQSTVCFNFLTSSIPASGLGFESVYARDEPRVLEDSARAGADAEVDGHARPESGRLFGPQLAPAAPLAGEGGGDAPRRVTGLDRV